MYNVLDISRYIINYSEKQNYGVSNLKLQKLLYFIQAYFLITTEDNRPCFKERIEAWNFGPVVPIAYNEYKQYASSDIPPIKTYIKLDKSDPWNSVKIDYDDSQISETDKNLINAVIDKFADYSAALLTEISQHQSPWIDAYAESYHNEIKMISIKNYFGNHIPVKEVK